MGVRLVEKPSLLARIIEWALWRLRIKAELQETRGLRERVVKSRPADPRPPRSFYRRYHVREDRRDGRPIFTLARRDGRTRQHILYLHGGSYVYEILDLQWKMISPLLDRAEVAITVPLYPLAPEWTCEQILPWVGDVYHTLVNEAGGKPVSLLGDSAGGGMALSLSQVLRDTGARLPDHLVLIAPWLDVTCSDPIQAELDKSDPMLSLPGLREEGLWYAGGLPPTDPRVSPLFGAFQGLPSILLLTGTHDLLNRDAHRLEKAMAAIPGALQISEYQNMIHVWPALPIPEAQMAIDEILAFLAPPGSEPP